MAEQSIYRDIAQRTGGDIYVGVVGPVRTGKSTFIKRFMEALVLPNMENEYDRERATDEMPQSAAGKTVMTTEPKFIPDEAVSVTLDGVSRMSVKMVDCVGYVVSDALGQTENGQPRMVNTPWSEEPMSFGEAAEMGTRKVITDHSTVGVLVTSDGSFTDIPRAQYEEAERRVVEELQKISKPFALVLNSAHPESAESEALALSLEKEYGAPVALVNCLELDREDIRRILELILFEFPVTEISVDLPEWTLALEDDHPVSASIRSELMKAAEKIFKVGQIDSAIKEMASESEYMAKLAIESIDLGKGSCCISAELDPALYYKVLSQLTGYDISDEEKLISTFRELSRVKTKYDRISSALEDVDSKGYGIVIPDEEDMRLEEPKIVRHSNGYGVRLKASAPSIHMIKATIQTEINPVVGTEQQSEDLVKFLLDEFEENPAKIWSTNLFGKTLNELVNEGIHAKLANMPEDAREKLGETLGRIINEGSSGLICIIL